MAYDFTSRGQRGLIRTAAQDHRAQLDEQLANSAAVQRSYFANHPVTPNPGPGPSQPDGIDYSEAATSMTGNPPNLEPSGPGFLDRQMADRLAANKAAQAPVPTLNTGPELQKMAVPQLAAAPTGQPNIAPTALEPRGPISASVTPSAQDSIAQANERARTELNLIRARERQDLQERNAAMQANVNYANAWQDRQRAESDARIANFVARNGADVVLGSPGVEANAAMQQAAVANANLAGANARFAQATGPAPQRNFIAEAAQEEQIREQARTGQSNRTGQAITQQGGLIGNQVAQMKLEEQQRINDVGTKLAAATDPAERERLSATLLNLMGKDPRDGTKAIPISMPDSVDPNTGAVLKGGQAVALVYPNGQREIVRMDSPTASAPPAAAVDLLKKNPAMAAAFDQKYGAGAAARALGK